MSNFQPVSVFGQLTLLPDGVSSRSANSGMVGEVSHPIAISELLWSRWSAWRCHIRPSFNLIFDIWLPYFSITTLESHLGPKLKLQHSTLSPTLKFREQECASTFTFCDICWVFTLWRTLGYKRSKCVRILRPIKSSAGVIPVVLCSVTQHLNKWKALKCKPSACFIMQWNIPLATGIS